MINRTMLCRGAISCYLLAALMLATLPVFSDAGPAAPARPADVSDLSDDGRWDDGFGFGLQESDYARVNSIAVVGNNVYVGGRFGAAGNVPANCVARWDGSSWSSLNGGIGLCQGALCFPTVYTLAVKGGEIYAGGSFASVGGVPANRVAKWDGNKWSAIGGGIQICDPGYDCVSVTSMAATSTDVYAVGTIISDISRGGTATLDGITKWNGNNWDILGRVSGAGQTLSLYTIETTGPRAYVGGNFTLAGVIGANNIAAWDGSNWIALGAGVQGCADEGRWYGCAPFVYTIATHGEDVYAGGNFTSAGNKPANFIAKWDGNDWTPLGEGANGPVRKIAINGKYIYAGGSFTSIGGVKANGIARFDGSEWSALGSGVDGIVDAIAFKDNEVYVGGFFGKAGGKTIHNFARWIAPEVAPPAPALPLIARVSISHKRLIVTGERFDLGAVIHLNGERQKTQNDEQNPTMTLIAKKSGKKVANGDRIQVENSDGKLSPEFIVVR